MSKQHRRAFLPAYKRCPGGHTKQTIGDLLAFLTRFPAETPIGVWCHEGEGSEHLEGRELSLKGVEYRVYHEMEPGRYGREHLLFNIGIAVEEKAEYEPIQPLTKQEIRRVLGWEFGPKEYADIQD